VRRLSRISLPGSAAAAIAVVSLLNVPALADKPATVLDRPVAVSVSAIPIDFDRENPSRKEFGKLLFRSGLNLFANSRHFGGYSGIALDPSGQTLLAISDAGTWLRATLDYDGRKLRGLGDARLGPLLGKDGKPLRDDQERDSEAFALVDGTPGKGTAYVSFERRHRIERCPFDGQRFGPPSGSVPLPGPAKRMTRNSGLEAIAFIRNGPLEGTLIAFAEHLTDSKGNLQGWLIGGSSPGPLALKRIAGFDITDAAALPDGGIVLLERKFNYSEGIKMRVRRISAAELKRRGLIQGEVLLEADGTLNIDNMEAIAAYRAASGETVLTLMSDDNFNPLQRTLVLQFTMPETTPVVAGPKP
jgi:hypothetical protein